MLSSRPGSRSRGLSFVRNPSPLSGAPQSEAPAPPQPESSGAGYSGAPLFPSWSRPDSGAFSERSLRELAGMGARGSLRDSLAGSAADGSGPVANEEQALLHRAAEEVQVTKEDRQEGYDTSLLALQPRGTGQTTPSSSSTNRLSTVSTTEPGSSVLPSIYSACNSYPVDSHEAGDESAPLAPTLPDPSLRTSSTYSISKPYDIPSISSPNPRRAAVAYSIRAQATETHALDLPGKKGGVGSIRSERPKSLSRRRKWLVALVAILILFVCVGVGVGVGVGYGVLRERRDSKQDNVASTSTSSSLAAGSSSVTPVASGTDLVTSDGSDSATSVAPATATTAATASNADGSADDGTNNGSDDGSYDNGAAPT